MQTPGGVLVGDLVLATAPYYDKRTGYQGQSVCTGPRIDLRDVCSRSQNSSPDTEQHYSNECSQDFLLSTFE